MRKVHAVAALALAALAAAGAALVVAPRKAAPPSFGDYVGAATCLSCHQERGTFLESAHHLTSRPATAGSIAGSFREGENVLRTANPYLHFRMEATPAGFFQTAVTGGQPGTRAHAERFDLVIGSGRKGQSYLSWQDGDRLVQLPVSYWTGLEAWVNSPGYRDGTPNFGRPATPRCLECHASYFEARPDSGVINRYDRTSYVLGVSCEKCHGPGREHVARQRSPLARYRGAAVVNPAELSRERQIEVCALCHGGMGEQTAPAFTYTPGKRLEDHLRLKSAGSSGAVDVHGNQVALLARSACFNASAMTCSTCHDVHLPQREAAAFSSRCLACHQAEDHAALPGRSASIAGGCVDCHMPELPSNRVVSTHEGRRMRPRVRTHWIRVYPEVGDR